jgi:hypothetical protein
MAFDWRDHDGLPLEERFDSGISGLPPILGLQAWSNLLHTLREMDGLEVDRETTAVHDALLAAFSGFLGAVDAEQPPGVPRRLPSAGPVVFVSHQRLDIKEAERMANLARNHGMDYWLDIHDPLLILANKQISPSDARYPIIIAAIIEVALLNSTHLIAVHTKNSLASKWVPYELGRVRDRRIRSTNAGGWFHPKVQPSMCGDYVHLCRIARGGEGAVTNWLTGWTGGRSPPLPWRGNPTTQLP